MQRVSEVQVDRGFVLHSIERALTADGLNSLVRAVVERFTPPARALLFGGLLRNAVLSRRFVRSLPLRDLDIVVFGLSSDDELERRFKADPHRRNSFGGLKVKVRGAVIDIWRAELQLQIAGAGAMEATLESFLRCVTLTTDAVLFDVSGGLLCETGFIRSMQEETIDVGAASRWLPPWVAYHLAHLAYVATLTQFKLSERACGLVREASDAHVEQAIQYLESRRKLQDPERALKSLLEEAGG